MTMKPHVIFLRARYFNATKNAGRAPHEDGSTVLALMELHGARCAESWAVRRRGAICNGVNEQMTDDAFNEPRAKSKSLCWKPTEDSHKVYYGI
jgi:hypothetical protein